MLDQAKIAVGQTIDLTVQGLYVLDHDYRGTKKSEERLKVSGSVRGCGILAPPP